MWLATQSTAVLAGSDTYADAWGRRGVLIRLWREALDVVRVREHLQACLGSIAVHRSGFYADFARIRRRSRCALRLRRSGGRWSPLRLAVARLGGDFARSRLAHRVVPRRG